MFPCIGQMVVPPADDPAHEDSLICRVCQKPLTDLHHDPAEKMVLCYVCHDRVMRFTPQVTH